MVNGMKNYGKCNFEIEKPIKIIKSKHSNKTKRNRRIQYYYLIKAQEIILSNLFII